jgi:hypothetical protein
MAQRRNIGGLLKVSNCFNTPPGYLADYFSFQRKLENSSTIELNGKGTILSNKQPKVILKIS